MNKVFLIGRTTRDIELKTSSNGMQYCYFTLAVDRDYRDPKTQERVTDFIDIIAWRNNALFLDKYVTKGRLILVEANVQVRKVQQQGTFAANVIQLVCDKIEFVGPSSFQDRTPKENTDQQRYVYNDLDSKPVIVSDREELSFASGPDLIDDDDADLPF